MFKKISDGFVAKVDRSDRVAAGSRTALLKDGSILCVYMTQTKIGSNDFVPMASYSNDGDTWSAGRPIWPQYIGKKSIYVSVRPMPDGRLSLAGKWFDISYPGEAFWSDEAGGMKENQLIWCFSEDGISFPGPFSMDPPYYASAEQPGGLLAKRSGEMMIVYAPNQTIEKREPVITNRLVLLVSRDGGRTFAPRILGTVDREAVFAESWITELGDGTLVAGSWMIDNIEDPDVFYISKDSGVSFTGPHPMGFSGQTTSLTPYGHDTVLIPYVQRKHGTPGIWAALARPGTDRLELIVNEPVWKAASTTRSNTSGDFSEWTDFSFGEPQITVLKDGTFLLVLWCDQPDGKGIRYVRLEGGRK